jgi:hypothetical protein
VGACSGAAGLALLISLPWVLEIVSKPRTASWGFGIAIGVVALAAFLLVVSWRLLMNRPRPDGGLLPASFLVAFGLVWGAVALYVLVVRRDRMPDPLAAGSLAVACLALAYARGRAKRPRVMSRGP